MRSITTATKAQKMLATQMQVLNSESSFLRGTSGQMLCPARLRHTAKLRVGVPQEIWLKWG